LKFIEEDYKFVKEAVLDGSIENRENYIQSAHEREIAYQIMNNNFDLDKEKSEYIF
jgi:hypothetical protein